MPINYYAVLICAILSVVIGGIWYGPLFGKQWMQIVGFDDNDLESKGKMKKSAGPLYLVQFFMTLFQVYVLAHYIAGWKEATSLQNALLICAAFVIPTVAGGCMWNNQSAEISWSRFFIQSGYQIILFVIFGIILGTWS